MTPQLGQEGRSGRLRFKILLDNDVLVRIKLFPRFDGAEYITVVGKMKEFHANQYRLIKAGREAPTAKSH
jgi:hypothetical protein